MIKHIDLGNKGIFKFSTFTGKNIYLVYKQDATINQILSTFSLNYSSSSGCHIYYKSVTLQRIFDKNDLVKKPSDLNLSQNETILLSQEKNIEPINEYTSDRTEKLINDNGNINLFVRTFNNETILLHVRDNYTVRDIKNMIFNKIGVRVDEQRLVHSSMQLNDNKILRDYGIGKNNEPFATVSLLLRLCGGMFNETSGKNGNYQPLHDCLIEMD